ncbi:MAG: CBS domain-containing protein, partial [Desulfitobacterium hafniense]|nr:CBS domain-containing protein [Desulfitobacterium hafniense]
MNIILSHRQLDFDALASMLAASKLHPDYELVLDGKSNAYVQEFLALSKDSLPFKDLHNVELDQIDKVILVDTHELQRAGVLGSKLTNKPGIELLIYDHHPYSGVKMPNVIIEPVGACTSILVEKIMDLGIPLSSFEATLLALGIYDDTGSLIFETTTAKDVKAVAFLIEQGANLGVVATYLRKSLTQEQKDLLYELLDNGNTEVFSGSPVYIAYAQCPDYIGGLALLAHRIGELEGADTLFLVVKMENRVYVVGRSKNRGLPVNDIIKAFGGAGHENAASASIKGIEVPEVLTKLRDEINLRIRNPYLVKDIMSYPVRHVSPDTKLQEVEHLLLKYGHTGVPVVEAGRLVGVISRRDVQKAVQHGLEHAPVKGFMTKEVIVVPPDASWEEVQRLMVEYDIGRIPVVLDHQLVGIVSRSDILRLVHGGAVAIEADLAHERSKVLRQDIQDLLANLPDYVGNLIQNASLVADELNYSVYIVGGFVRDLLLGNPTKDIDFVVEGNSSIFASTLASRLTDLELTVHSQFGTATLNFPDGTHVDVARTRWEHYQFPGALPQVEESTIKEDLFRRDFTINAMAICINLDRYGQLVDYYGGLRDLRQAEIRVLHNLSFIDDPTRILRAVRFAQRYGFHLAKETEEKIQTALAGGVLKKISSERFTQELFLILAEDKYTHML